MPKISIIVPVYKAEKYLNRCIDSILSQTFKDFELILVDDGSPDNCGKICDNYAVKDNRIKVIHKQNGGVSTARNVGIENSTGEYIMFVDSDDYIDNQMLEVLLQKTSDDVEMVISSIRMVCKEKVYDFRMKNREYSPKVLMEEYCLEKFPRICVCGPCCKLYKRSVIDENKIRFNEGMSLGEDTDFNLQYIWVAKKIITTEEIYYFYMRDNEDSLFTKFRSNYYSDIRSVYQRTVDLVQRFECSEFVLSNLTQKHISGLVSNLLKAFLTSNKKECLEYMKKVANDKVFLENYTLFKKLNARHITALLLKYKKYNCLYFFMNVRYGFLKFKK